jgi:hypothetical protein
MAVSHNDAANECQFNDKTKTQCQWNKPQSKNVHTAEKDTVLETFQAIQLDARHRGVFVLIEEEIVSRKFASWSMGFRQLSKADLERLPVSANFFKVRPEEIALRAQPSDALTILESFADGSMGIS